MFRWSGLRAGGTLLALVLAVGCAEGQRTKLVPGFDLFSSDQDIQMGRQSSQEVESQLPMCDDARVDAYLNGLGRALASHAPGPRYPYQFKCVNDAAVNAFALPGGYVYVNRGTIELVSNEAQLGLRGGMGLISLRFSRADESEADILGTQIMYDTGYDPRAMAQFFEKIKAESEKRPIQFLSDHPNPDNRAGHVMEEVKSLGGPQAKYKADSAEFEKVKAEVHDLRRARKSLPNQ